MADFIRAIDTVLRHEGGYVVDHAGATNYGITVPTLARLGARGDIDGDGDTDANDVRRLPLEFAIEIYQRDWWDAYRYDLIEDQCIATKVFDLSVNIGPRQAHRVLQRACRACGEDLDDDGILGPLTRKATNDVKPEVLIAALRSEAAGFYRGLVAARPEHSKYLRGWLRRAYE